MRNRQESPRSSLLALLALFWAYTVAMEHPKLVLLQTYGSRPEADVAMSVLEAAGIPAFSQADTAGGMREHLAWSGEGFQIVVREEDAAAAHELLTPPTGAPANEGEEKPDDGSQADTNSGPPLRRFT
jgi:putative signal transducing protein